jgi:hypothetical protein
MAGVRLTEPGVGQMPWAYLIARIRPWRFQDRRLPRCNGPIDGGQRESLLRGQCRATKCVAEKRNSSERYWRIGDRCARWTTDRGKFADLIAESAVATTTLDRWTARPIRPSRNALTPAETVIPCSPTHFICGRSLVRSQPGPQAAAQVNCGSCPISGPHTRYVPDGHSKIVAKSASSRHRWLLERSSFSAIAEWRCGW